MSAITNEPVVFANRHNRTAIKYALPSMAFSALYFVLLMAGFVAGTCAPARARLRLERG